MSGFFYAFFSADGVVNMVEYAAFAASWLVPDSNELFIPQCDLNNDNFIDLADYAQFCDAWLWAACWRLDLQELLTQQMMMSSVDNVAEASSFGMFTELDPLYSAQSSPVKSAQLVVEEKSIEQQILTLQDTITFLDQIWLEEPNLQREINSEDWKAFVDAVYQSLSDLQTKSIQREELLDF
jgi:hypothetical protein